MEDQSPQPDPQQSDPAAEQALKAAIARGLPKENAPAALRQRILTAIAAEPLVAPSRPVTRPSTGLRGFVNRIPRSLAAAAVLMLAFSVYWMNRTVGPAIHNTAIAATLTSNMTQRHDACSLDHDHQMPNVPIADVAVLTEQFKKQLAHPAVVTALDAGWIYDGGRFCPVGKVMAAHLMFHKDGQELSIFSFPAPEGTDDGAYETQADNTHAIAGYVNGKTMVCIVISGSMGKDLVEAHRVRQLVSTQCGGPSFAECNSEVAPVTVVSQ